MALEIWIDTLCALWEISDLKNGTVRSFRFFNRAEFPEALSPEMIPCAITYPIRTIPHVGKSVSYSMTYGVTEFHLTASLNKTNLPYCAKFLLPIMQAAAGSITLNGLVASFLIDDGESGGIIGPVKMQYGGEDEHYGFIVNWKVKENLATAITVAA